MRISWVCIYIYIYVYQIWWFLYVFHMCFFLGWRMRNATPSNAIVVHEIWNWQTQMCSEFAKYIVYEYPNVISNITKLYVYIYIQTCYITVATCLLHVLNVKKDSLRFGGFLLNRSTPNHPSHSTMNYHLVMTNSSPWYRSPLLRTVNHLFRLGPSIPWLC